MGKMTFALCFGNRGFFPESLIALARKEITGALEKSGYSHITTDENATRYGAVETAEEGRKFAAFLKAHRGEYDGVILSLPNFGDETGLLPPSRIAALPYWYRLIRMKSVKWILSSAGMRSAASSP